MITFTLSRSPRRAILAQGAGASSFGLLLFPFTFLSLHYTPQHALCFGSSSASRFGGAACHRGAAQAAAPGPRRQRAPGGAADYSASRCRGQNGTTGA